MVAYRWLPIKRLKSLIGWRTQSVSRFAKGGRKSQGQDICDETMGAGDSAFKDVCMVFNLYTSLLLKNWVWIWICRNVLKLYLSTRGEWIKRDCWSCILIQRLSESVSLSRAILFAAFITTFHFCKNKSSGFGFVEWYLDILSSCSHTGRMTYVICWTAENPEVWMMSVPGISKQLHFTCVCWYEQILPC